MSLESIAIIGIGCRFPGSNNPKAFWQLLREGVDAITEVPPSRWNVDDYYDRDANKLDKTNSRWGGFIEGLEQFDPHFFGIAPKELETMDPQHRLLLEVTWESLEDALQIPGALAGTNTGVFVGIGSHDYSIKLWRKPVNNPYGTTGTAHSVAANRISYLLDLKGPSLAVDTACSSSLVAVHLACQSIWSGESCMALAGGVNALLLPEPMVGFTKSGFLSGDGRCKSFDAQANGYVRGEGAGMVVLKPLQRARTDGDLIYAVIRGTGVNQDGHSEGMAAPSHSAQVQLMLKTYRQAGVTPDRIHYIEAHGTGTKLGDRVELEAISTVFKENKRKCAIGSVKSNIGHLETASGIAGLIKVALSLHNRQIPPSLHCSNPTLDLSKSPLVIQQKLTSWPEIETSRMAGVNSFGFGGTNAHVVLEEAPPEERKENLSQSRFHLLTISAKSETALRDLAMEYQTLLEEQTLTPLEKICWSANTRRSGFNHRLAVVAENRQELARHLVDFGGTGQKRTGWNYARVLNRNAAPQIVFLFTGQGSQFVGMGQDLYETQPLFREQIDRCAAILQSYLDTPLLEILFDKGQDTSPIEIKLNQTVYTQPALFALEYALAQLWFSWGITPSVVLGHSLGEYVAACLAGVFSLEDGLFLVAERARLMQSLPSNGAMTSVLAAETTVRQAIADCGGTIAIAAINGPQHWVLSGERKEIENIEYQFQEKGIETTRLKVQSAFHSPLMQPMLEEFKRVAAKVTYHLPKINLISNLTGDFIVEDIATPEYWTRHISDTVNFEASIKTLEKYRYDVFIEIGSKPILTGMSRAIWTTSPEPLWLPLTGNIPVPASGYASEQKLLESLGQLYLADIPINWDGVGLPSSLVRLPTYTFQRQPFNWTASKPVSKRFTHPLLGLRNDLTFASQVSVNSPVYLKDHCLGNIPVFPAAAYLEMALAAASQIYGECQEIRLSNVLIEEPLILSEEPWDLEIAFTDPSTWQISSNTRHVSGQIEINLQKSSLDGITLSQAITKCSEAIPVENHYQKCQEIGLSYGVAFQGIKKLWRGEGKSLGQIELSNFLHLEAEPYLIHPTVLDACFQVLGTILEGSYLPFGLDTLVFYPTSHSSSFWSYASLRSSSNEKTVKADLRLWNEKGEIIADIQGLLLKARINKTSKATEPQLPTPFYQVLYESKPKINNSSQINLNNWLILADNSGLANQLAEQLQQEGACCALVFPCNFYSASQQKYTINPNELEDFKTLLANLPFRCEGVIHLWGTTQSEELKLNELQEETKLSCNSTINLIQALYAIQESHLPKLFIVTRGTLGYQDNMISVDFQQSSLWGLAKVIRLECPQLSCVSLALETIPSLEDGRIIYSELMFPDGEPEIAYYQGKRYVTRLVPLESKLKSNVELKISQYGSLENLTLVNLTPSPLAGDEVEIEVVAAGLNFRDVLNGLGMLQPYLEEMGFTTAQEMPFGGECAGRISRIGESVEGFKIGDEVIAAFAIGSIASFVKVKASFVIHKPQNLSFLEAATIPSAFLTAYYGLHLLGKIQKGERILIHAAAGGVGQAAVQLAQSIGAEVYATASPSKWEALKSMGVKHIFNSRTLDFASEIQHLTANRGVDLILNSLTGDFIAKNLEILSHSGRFIEIGKIGIWDIERVKQQRSDIDYQVFDLLTIAQKDPKLIATILTQLIPLFIKGNLRPLPQKIFPIDESIAAFRYMAGAKHIGKVVISMPTLTISQDGAYLITGGWGELGLQSAQWLVGKGAKNLILVGRKQPTAERKKIISSLKKQGVKINLHSVDISNPEQVNKLIDNIKLPLKGIIHTAGVLDDGVLLNQTWERWENVMAPKIAGTWNLHTATQSHQLDFFVCFSSVVSLFGSPGQSNYVAANTFMDTLINYRHSSGLPGISINWGPWMGNGMVSQVKDNTWKDKGISLIEPAWGLEILEQLIKGNAPQVGVLQVDWSKFLTQQQSQTRFFNAVKKEVVPPATPVATSHFTEKGKLVIYLQNQLAKVLGYSSHDDISIEQDFSDFGLDSLMGVEFRNILQTDLSISISSNVVFDYPTISLLADYLFREVLGQVVVEPTPEEDIPPKFYQFELGSEFQSLERDLEEVKQLGNLFFTVHDGIANNKISIAGKELINYSSYNYLGISGNSNVCRAAQEAIDKYGTSVSASRVLSGEIPLHQELEKEIADFLGTESSIVYIGGHSTNVSTIGHLFGKNDLILYDAFSHNSIEQGCFISGATSMSFSHNDHRNLKDLLDQYRRQYEKVLIVIEGIYSADGDIAPLPEFIELKKRYKTFLMVDEAHSIGVLGATGRGIGEHFGVSPTDVDLWMGTLSKSFASCGGYIAAKESIVRYLKYTSPGFVFSVGMSPANTAAALAAIRVLKAEPQRVKSLQDNSLFFLTSLKALKYNIGGSINSPIVPLIVGEPQRAVNLSNALLRQGINVQPMVYPSVPYNASRLRFFITSEHTKEQINLTVKKLAEEYRI